MQTARGQPCLGIPGETLTPTAKPHTPPVEPLPSPWAFLQAMPKFVSLDVSEVPGSSTHRVKVHSTTGQDVKQPCAQRNCVLDHLLCKVKLVKQGLPLKTTLPILNHRADHINSVDSLNCVPISSCMVNA